MWRRNGAIEAEDLETIEWLHENWLIIKNEYLNHEIFGKYKPCFSVPGGKTGADYKAEIKQAEKEKIYTIPECPDHIKTQLGQQ